ncbi:MAG TPA: enoyl-[acyl-carrier-protein] reductase FabL [Actinomycetota bacterium]|nr:enoyl-[acyl-carrier-protein] reductase FabL [Actinomycetota bacterium]
MSRLLASMTMSRDLEGKVALVTGGGRGIGRAISLELAARGANVVIAFLRKRSAAEETCAEIEGHGVKADAVRCDVGDANKIDVLFDHIDETFGRLDVFVSNAATGVIRPVEDLDARAWEWTMNANARALLLGARRAAKLMTDGSNIIALSSLGASRVMPGYAVVGASKAAIESIVRYLAVELAPSIRVNAVSPGVVDTDALTHFPMRDEMLDHALRTTPRDRLVTPEDVADAVSFLTSERASMITGQTLVIDGGSSLVA